MSEAVDQIPLIGHEAVKNYFASCLDMDRVASTYLLSGPPGIGKRKLAKYFAQLYLCENRQWDAPCQMCTPCQNMKKEGSLYFIELDFIAQKGKDESAVDVTRRFIENINRTSNEEHHCFYLIPRFEVYSVQVQNALLKTFEEAPSGVSFILTSDSSVGVLETIQSRCHMINVAPLSLEEISRILKHHQFDDQQAQKLAGVCEGRVDLALKFSKPAYIRLFEWFESIDKNSRSDFIEVSDEAAELANDLDGNEGASSKDRARVSELCQLYLKQTMTHLVALTRKHFVATQLLNTTIDELLSASESISRSGHLRLSLEHFFNLALARHNQVKRYAGMREAE